MRNFLKTTTCLGSIALLAACGSSADNTPNIDAAEEALRVFSVGTGDAKDVFAELDGTLYARKAGTAAMELDYVEGVSGLTNAEVSVFRNSNDEFTLVVNGVEHVFETANRENDFGYSIEDEENGIFVFAGSEEGELDQFLNNESGSGYSMVMTYQTNLVNDPGPDVRGYAVFGTETADADVGTLSELTYSGRAKLDVYPEVGFVNNSTSRTRVRFDDVTMSVNLASNEISGVMDDIGVRDPGEEDFVYYEGTVSMDPAAFDVNAFGGTLTSSDTLLANAPQLDIGGTASYSGAFYGVAGEEAAGTLTVSGTGEDGALNGVGFFSVNSYD